MNFHFTGFIFNSFVIVFFTMVLGNLFGQIRIKKFSFGITGTLFMGLGVGYYLTKYASRVTGASKYYDRAQLILRGQIIDANILKFSLLIFIVGTGLLASKEMKYALSKFGKEFIIMAILIPLMGASTSYAFTHFFEDLSPYQVTGNYTGALTSSAGLAAAIESAGEESKMVAEKYDDLGDKQKQKILDVINRSKKQEAELLHEDAPAIMDLDNTENLETADADIYVAEAKAGVGVGHAIGYPFGVLFMILGINLLPTIFRFNVEEERKKYFAKKEADMLANEELAPKEQEEVIMDFVGFSLAAFLGYLLGSIKFYMGPLGYFSVGSIGGSIIMALVLGTIGKIGPINFRMNSMVLGKMRTYFLSLFLAGTGANYGFKAVNAIMGEGLTLAFISMVVTLVAVTGGFLIGHYIFKVNWTVLSGAITGGMTSAPGLGAAIDAVGSDEPAVSYGATQPLATLCMVIFSIIIHKLPL